MNERIRKLEWKVQLEKDEEMLFAETEIVYCKIQNSQEDSIIDQHVGIEFDQEYEELNEEEEFGL